jgi:hypothetical protein
LEEEKRGLKKPTSSRRWSGGSRPDSRDSISTFGSRDEMDRDGDGDRGKDWEGGRREVSRYMCICTLIYAVICIYVYSYMHIYMYIYMCIYIYVHMFIHASTIAYDHISIE